MVEPYVVRSAYGGNAVVGAFVCEHDAKDFAAYRQAMIEKYDNSGITDFSEV